ncbi:MAG: hypothetical protein C0469_13260 [Cyanobacteria bacterium DS2.3.42]|nr:hypothetical protein [Cyanobacteria bacterium DS2.3.42]
MSYGSLSSRFLKRSTKVDSNSFSWTLALMNRCKTAASSIRAFLKSAVSSLLLRTSAERREDAEQYPINKVIWMVWLQGWNNAPWLVQKCLASWQFHNPDWEIRALDANSLQRYIELPELDGKEITATNMSDIVRTLLLHEYGGVWCDATLLCHRPLDSWLPDAMCAGFFAFDRPAPDRVLSTWFIATTEGHLLIERLHAAVLQFWKDEDRAGSHFWIHYVFEKLCVSDSQFGSAWNKVPKISADGPHMPQWKGLLEESESVIEETLLSLAPVSKLTYRFDENAFTEKTLLSRLLSDLPEPILPLVRQHSDAPRVAKPLNSIRLSTQNLGDHIQLLASQRLIERTYEPFTFFIDLDDEIYSCPGLDLTLSFPRRTYAPGPHEVFAVSRDQEILSILPPSLSEASFISHHVSGRDFEENMQAAAALLETYRSRARLIVTTMLHCALPAIAMGIPVVMFYPKNDETEYASDRERFTSLAKLIPIYRFEDAMQVDWEPKPVSVVAEKLRIVDSFFQLTERWQLPSRNRFPRLAPLSVCPPPGGAAFGVEPDIPAAL